MTTSEADRCAGVILGLSAGDRNGGPIRMAVCLAESLAELHRFDVASVTQKYLSWYDREGFDTGPIADFAFRNLLELQKKEPLTEEAIFDVSQKTHEKGCNAAHRSPILSMCKFLDIPTLRDSALKDAQITHWDPLAGQTALAINLICRNLILGNSFLDSVKMTFESFSDVWDVKIKNVLNLEGSQEMKESDLNRGGFSPDVLKAALYFVGNSDNFEDALLSSIRFAGPANYCPVTVGAIAGARWGASSIDRDLIAFYSPALVRVTETLSAEWSQ